MATFSVRASSLHQPRAYQTRRWLTAAAHTRASVEASGATSLVLLGMLARKENLIFYSVLCF